MRRLTAVCVILCSFCGLLTAQTEPLSLVFSPPAISVNALNLAAFDPANAGNQPFLTDLTITNVSGAPVDFDLNLVVTWNNPSHQLVNLVFPTNQPIQPGEQWLIRNRDLFTDQPGIHLGKPVGSIDVIQMMESDPILASAAEAGRFPDGKLHFDVTLTPRDKKLRAVSASCVISITNITSIFPAYPGKPAGQAPPKVNLKPVTFLWHSLLTGFNSFRLTIREFDAAPKASTVESAGRLFFEGDIDSGIFSEFLPFQRLYYYAWRVQTTLVNESNFLDVSRSRNYLSSPWYVFQYDDSHSGIDTVSQELLALLNLLNDPKIRELLNAGYLPTGIVIQDGQAYTGQAAVNLVNTLAGKAIDVEITEQ